MIPVALLITVFVPEAFWNQMAAELTPRIVPLLVIVLPLPSGLTASADPCVPAERTVPPCYTVSVLLLRKSMVFAPVPYRPPFVFAVFWTSAPLDTVMLAVSARAIAVASPTTTCALGPILTTAPAGVLGPVPIVLVHGEGVVVSQVVVLPAVVQFAYTGAGRNAMTAETATDATGTQSPGRNAGRRRRCSGDESKRGDGVGFDADG
jgi:hypothetical protein